MNDKRNKRISTKSSTSKVYYVSASMGYEEGRDVFSLNTVLAHRMFHLLSVFKQHDIVGVLPCDNGVEDSFRYAKAFTSLLIQSRCSSFVCSTSNRHMDYQDNSIVRAQAFLDRFNALENPLPFMSLDGVNGEYEISRKIDERLADDVYLAGELPVIDGVVSVCCFDVEGNDKALGSIASLGQGLASKKGKIHQRTTTCPQNNIEKCYACRRCVYACPSNAIKMINDHAEIDPRKCIKCGKCVEIAHYGGITYNWNATPEHYNRSIAQHAKGVFDVLNNKVVCVNIIANTDSSGRLFAGAMISRDPVAVDAATMDYFEEAGLSSNSYIDSIRCQIKAGQQAGVGEVDYTIDTVAYK